jgi:transposase
MRARACWRTSGKRSCWIGSSRSAKSEAGETAGGKQRSDSIHVVARVRSLSSAGMRWRNAACHPRQVFQCWHLIGWFSTLPLIGLSACRHRVEHYRLPKAESQRTLLAQQIGADGLHLLQALEKPDAPEMLKNEASVY